MDDVQVTVESFTQVHLNRNTERFSPLLTFCRMVLLGQTPLPGLGGERTFSLLFPMEQVFEAFVAGFIRRHARQLGLQLAHVRIQSAGLSRWLVKTPEGRGRFGLRPDIVITGHGGVTRTILDTKWKRPKADAEDVKNGIPQADMYQLYAYAHRFQSPDNLLLYPAVAGASAKSYILQDTVMPSRLRVEFLDLNRDLRKERATLLNDIRRILGTSAAGLIAA